MTERQSSPSIAPEILLRIRRGDNDAARRLHAHCAQRLRVLAVSILRDEASAGDIVQSAFMKILTVPKNDLKEVRDPVAWLARITRNLSLNRIRDDYRLRERARASSLASDFPRQEAFGEKGRSRTQDDLLDALSLMDDDARDLIVLKHFVGLTFDQLAIALDEPRSTIASRHRAAIEALRRLLIKLDPGLAGGTAGTARKGAPHVEAPRPESRPASAMEEGRPSHA